MLQKNTSQPLLAKKAQIDQHCLIINLMDQDYNLQSSRYLLLQQQYLYQQFEALNTTMDQSVSSFQKDQKLYSAMDVLFLSNELMDFTNQMQKLVTVVHLKMIGPVKSKKVQMLQDLMMKIKSTTLSRLQIQEFGTQICLTLFNDDINIEKSQLILYYCHQWFQIAKQQFQNLISKIQNCQKYLNQKKKKMNNISNKKSVVQLKRKNNQIKKNSVQKKQKIPLLLKFPRIKQNVFNFKIEQPYDLQIHEQCYIQYRGKLSNRSKSLNYKIRQKNLHKKVNYKWQQLKQFLSDKIFWSVPVINNRDEIGTQPVQSSQRPIYEQQGTRFVQSLATQPVQSSQGTMSHAYSEFSLLRGGNQQHGNFYLVQRQSFSHKLAEPLLQRSSPLPAP